MTKPDALRMAITGAWWRRPLLRPVWGAMASGGTSQAIVPRTGFVNTQSTCRMEYGK